ncbi:FlgO family outer membrane protein [Candidatus Parabeggiatoa sp. HSG14]|uniref:FlgO family outer membrane protein n=1 Tax=Candidatus Parabeggiatoa sp. HSG14 TaxID=3055593 RepID=UPI0025A8E227|nr:FlgO family outer membrane protein [Thiotrichales bacterium HSG14]
MLHIHHFIKLLILPILFFSLFTIGLTGCSAHRMAYGKCAYRVKSGECYQEKAIKDADIMVTSYAAADHLMYDINKKPYSRLLVTSVADIDNLEDSTSLGRLIGEQISARFAQKGYNVIEAKFQSDLYAIPRTGEFVLSRDLRETKGAYKNDRIVSGTYAVGEDRVYVTLKMLSFKNSKVMSSYAYTLPIGPNTSALLQKSWWW